MALKALGVHLSTLAMPSVLHASSKLRILAEKDVPPNTVEAHAILKEVVGTKVALLSGGI
jgi:hypothetical protein